MYLGVVDDDISPRFEISLFIVEGRIANEQKEICFLRHKQRTNH